MEHYRQGRRRLPYGAGVLPLRVIFVSEAKEGLEDVVVVDADPRRGTIAVRLGKRGDAGQTLVREIAPRRLMDVHDVTALPEVDV